MSSGDVIRVPTGDMSDELTEVAGKLVYFICADVTGATWSPGHVDIALAAGAGAEARQRVTRDVPALIARLRSGHRPLPKKRVFERRAPGAPALGVGGEALTRALVEAGFVRPEGPGAYAFGPRFVAVLEAIDARLRLVAIEAMSASERAFPALVPANVLHRAGYLASFPQNVGFVSHLPHDLAAIERFRAASAASPRFVAPAETAPPAACLPPAVCHHRFHELGGDTVSRGNVITARGACFRYEARNNMRDLSRLWCFQMREVVYVGDAAFVGESAARAEGVLEGVVGELHLSGVCETASDPFFADVFAEKRYAQVLHDRKHELRLPLGEGETVAAASINAHEEHFGRAFDITLPPGAPAVSGCLAFGLERLTLAFLAQHGLDEATWPAPVRRFALERARGS